VPLLGPDDDLPSRPKRVLVAGTSGSGKSTLARQIATALQIPYVELDALHHGPGWVPRPDFVADVHAFAATDSWVTEWQYTAVRTLLAERAEVIVWLDLPTAVVMQRVVVRTLRRRLRREVLWNGNTEPPLRAVFTDPDHIVRWAWKTRHATAERVAAVLEERPELVVVRLRTATEVERWSGALG
jgi:adenylate kinase family enzyme